MPISYFKKSVTNISSPAYEALYAFYFSKTGSNSNSGLTTALPKKTLLTTSSQASSREETYNRKHIVGSGYYRVSNIGHITVGGNFPNVINEIFEGDGKVVVDCSGYTASLGVSACYKNLTILNGQLNSQGQHFNVPGYCYGYGNFFEQCYVSNTTGYWATQNLGTYHVHRLLNSIFVNCSITALVVSNRYIQAIYGCILTGGTNGGIYDTNRLINTYTAPDTTVRFNLTSGAAVPITTWENSYTSITTSLGYCNIRGTILIQGTYYAVQDLLTGTPQSNGYATGVRWLNETELTSAGYTGTITGWNAVVATLMNRDPKFVDATNNVYLLQSDSPHLGAGYASSNIGGTFTGSKYATNGSNVTSSAEIDTSVPSALKLGISETKGTVTFGPYYISGKMAKLGLMSDFFFDSDYAGGTNENNNVPDAEPDTAGYPALKVTVAAGTTTTYIVANADAPTNGWYAIVSGQIRLITNVQTNTPTSGQTTVTLTSALSAATTSGMIVTHGAENVIGLMTPNRLCVEIRTSSNASNDPPDIEADWDNRGFGVAQQFYLVELDEKPYMYNVSGTWYGSGDTLRPSGGYTREIAKCWYQVRVTLRNNFSHTGL